MEPAGQDDLAAVQEIIRRHEGPEARAALTGWVDSLPGSINVCRDLEGAVSGFSIVARGNEVCAPVLHADPVAAAWLWDIKRNGSATNSLLIRRILDAEAGEANSGSRGALSLDAKRTYMEMRPNLRYIYLGGTEPENFDWCDPLGFTRIVDADQTFDAAPFRSYRLDMGPRSVDGWLARLVGEELGVEDSPQSQRLFDAEAQELVLPSGRIALTPLEYGVMRVLAAHPGKPVSRAGLLEEVWGYETDTTSNVIDAVVASLRRKL